MTCHQLTRAVAQANTFEAIGNKQAGKQRKPEAQSARGGMTRC